MLIANVIGQFLFLYLYWKRLKEDYSIEKVFNSGFVLLIGILLAFLVSNLFLHNYWFWIFFLFLAISETILVLKLKLKFFESLEALVVSILPWLSIFYLSNSIVQKSLSSFLLFWMSLICIFLFFLFDNFYRTITWYKSGRVGFSGLAILGIFFLIRLIVSIFFNDLISFAPNFESFLSGTVAFVSFLLLFNLSIKNG